MNLPYIHSSQSENGSWQAFFAFWVRHQKYRDWLKMRWGFNSGALLEEALDRNKLFVEAQAANVSINALDTMIEEQSLALRVINLPGGGLQAALIGKVSAQAGTEEKIKAAALDFAQEVEATFPYDFILEPAQSSEDFHKLFGADFLKKNLNMVQIRRGSALKDRYMPAFWQASSRSNEQIWRSLSHAREKTLFNITIMPTVLYPADKDFFWQVSETEEYPLAKKAAESRLEIGKKYFLVQIHLVTARTPNKNILRTIGSALTRDLSDTTLPAYQVSRDIPQDWHKKIFEMDLPRITHRVADIADADETAAVFRLPHPPEFGLPGVKFLGGVQQVDAERREEE